MRKARGPRAHWALAVALLVGIANASDALGMARSMLSAAAEEGQGPALITGASLDRTTAALDRGLARTSAVAAAAARARILGSGEPIAAAPATVQAGPVAPAHVPSRPAPVRTGVRPNHVWIPS